MFKVDHLIPQPQVLTMEGMLPFAAFTSCDLASFSQDSHPRVLPPADWSHINWLLHSTFGEHVDL